VELSFIINAVKRRPWIIVLFVALGAAAGQLATPAAAPKYYSRAVLNVSPPSQSRVAVSFSNDPDRYVIGQLSVLNSAQLAERNRIKTVPVLAPRGKILPAATPTALHPRMPWSSFLLRDLDGAIWHGEMEDRPGQFGKLVPESGIDPPGNPCVFSNHLPMVPHAHITLSGSYPWKENGPGGFWGKQQKKAML
jgi:hypothetical protein